MPTFIDLQHHRHAHTHRSLNVIDQSLLTAQSIHTPPFDETRNTNNTQIRAWQRKRVQQKEEEEEEDEEEEHQSQLQATTANGTPLQSPPLQFIGPPPKSTPRQIK